MNRRIRTYAELAGPDRSDLVGQLQAQAERTADRLREVQHVVGVMSGKGGVGKSFLAAALALGIARRGARTALLDADLGSPTAGRFLGLGRPTLRVEEETVCPVELPSGLAVISTDLLLPPGAPLTWSGPEMDQFVWRGAQERAALREFLSDVGWGRRELLLVDLPPGTDRVLDLAELVPDLAGVVAVTIPSAASADSVERSLRLCRGRGVNLLGLVENMAGYACPSCGATGRLFAGEATRRLAAAFGLPLLGSVPFDPELGAHAERGELGAWLEGAGASVEIERVAERLWEQLGAQKGETEV